MSLFSKSIFLVGIILFTLFELVIPAQALEYTGFGGRPAFPREDNPRTNSIFVHTITPGQVIDEGVFIINNTQDRKTFRVYGADFIPSSGGGFACRQYSEDSVSVGNWLHLETNEVTLDAGTNQFIPFTISIPGNVGVGEHNGCILVEEKKDVDKDQAGLVLSFRTGLRVALTVPGKIDKRLEINEFSSTAREDGSTLLNLFMQNSGNVSIDSKIAIKVMDFLGREVGVFGGEYTILRDDTSEFHFEFKQPFWGGRYSAISSAIYDPRKDIEIGQDDFAKDGIILDGGEIIFYVLPQPKAIGIIGLVIGIVFMVIGIIAFRVRQRLWVKKTWKKYKVKEGEDILSLSEKHSVSWKLVGRMNGLKPPYHLDKGDEIILPPPIKKKRKTSISKKTKKEDVSSKK